MLGIGYNNFTNKGLNPYFSGKNRKDDYRGIEIVKMDKEQKKDTYSQVSACFDMNSTADEFKTKIKRLPFVMDKMMNSVYLYIKGQKTTDKFASDFVDDGIIIIKRAKAGDDAEKYSEAYAPELKVIRDISPVCSQYKSGETDKKSLDSAVEKSVTEYIKDNTQRKCHFIA